MSSCLRIYQHYVQSELYTILHFLSTIDKIYTLCTKKLLRQSSYIMKSLKVKYNRMFKCIHPYNRRHNPISIKWWSPVFMHTRETSALYAAELDAPAHYWLAAFTPPTNGTGESYCPRPIGGQNGGGALINTPFLLGVLLFFTDRFEWGGGGGGWESEPFSRLPIRKT